MIPGILSDYKAIRFTMNDGEEYIIGTDEPKKPLGAGRVCLGTCSGVSRPAAEDIGITELGF